nr:MFS transporter [Frankia sp. CcI49]
MGQPRRPARLRHRDVGGVPADPLPAEGPEPHAVAVRSRVRGPRPRHVVGGLLGPRVIARLGGRQAVVLGFVAQCAATVPLAFLGDAPGWLADLLAATFVGGVANLVAIVGFMVTATSGLAGGEQGLATGLATMSQQVGIALGTPVMSAIATASEAETPHGILHGVTTALAVNAALCLAAAILLAITLPTDTSSTGTSSTGTSPTGRRNSESAA